MRYGLLFFGFLVSISTSAHAADRLRIATEGAYPPFNMVAEDGTLKGFDVDIAEALCAKMKAECTFEAVEWSKIIDGLENNSYDLIVASMAYTKERAARVEFSVPYYRSHSVLVGDAEKYAESTPDAVAGAKIAAAEGTIQSDYMKQTYTKSSHLLAKDQPAAQQLLITHKADMLIGDAIELLSFMQTEEGSAFGYIGDPISSEFLQSSAHIAAQKGQTELVGKINEAIKDMKLDGTYDKINDAYFPFSIY